MDNGYSKWLEERKYIKLKRRDLFLKLCIPALGIMFFVFLFGYDLPMFSKEKLLKFIPGSIGLIAVIFIISLLRSKTLKYIPTCNKCGRKIMNIKNDCVVGKIDYLGTEDNIIYKNVKTNIKGTTTYPRGGYSMRNDIFEHKSETNYEINQSTPIVQKVHIYNIEYKCKYCNEIYCNLKERSITPIHK